MQSKRQWNDIYKILKEKSVSPVKLKVAFKNESEINTLSDKQKMREINRRHTLQEILRKCLQAKECDSIEKPGSTQGKERL